MPKGLTMKYIKTRSQGKIVIKNIRFDKTLAIIG
jgi:hypothetical protein